MIWYEINVEPRVGGGDVSGKSYVNTRLSGLERGGRACLMFMPSKPFHHWDLSLRISWLFPFSCISDIQAYLSIDWTIWTSRMYALANLLNFLSIWETLNCFCLRDVCTHCRPTQGLWMYRPLWFRFLDQSNWPRLGKNKWAVVHRCQNKLANNSQLSQNLQNQSICVVFWVCKIKA